MGDLVREPTKLLGDNKQAGRWAREDMITNGNRFIERMYFKVREGVQAGHIEPRYINTKLNPSDLFTKDVPREVIEALAGMFNGSVATGVRPHTKRSKIGDRVPVHVGTWYAPIGIVLISSSIDEFDRWCRWFWRTRPRILHSGTYTD